MPRFPSSSCVNRNMPGSRGRGDVAHALSALFGAAPLRRRIPTRSLDRSFPRQRGLRRDCYHGLVLGRVYQWDSSVSVASTCAARGAISAGDALGPVGFPAALPALNAAWLGEILAIEGACEEVPEISSLRARIRTELANFNFPKNCPVRRELNRLGSLARRIR
jgi:hypothetical protein